MLPRLEQALQLLGGPAFERGHQGAVQRASDVHDRLEVVGGVGLDLELAALRSRRGGLGGGGAVVLERELAALRSRTGRSEADQDRQARTGSHGRRERVADDLEGRAALIAVVLVVVAMPVLPVIALVVVRRLVAVVVITTASTYTLAAASAAGAVVAGRAPPTRRVVAVVVTTTASPSTPAAASAAVAVVAAGLPRIRQECDLQHVQVALAD